jgi:hypothetical protein
MVVHYLRAAVVAVLMMGTGLRAQLRVGYYDSSCPAAEIVAQQGRGGQPGPRRRPAPAPLPRLLRQGRWPLAARLNRALARNAAAEPELTVCVCVWLRRGATRRC